MEHPQPVNPNQISGPEQFDADHFFHTLVRPEEVPQDATGHLPQAIDTMLAMTKEFNRDHPEIPEPAYKAYLLTEAIRVKFHGQPVYGRPYRYLAKDPKGRILTINEALNTLREAGGSTDISEIQFEAMQIAAEKSRQNADNPLACIGSLELVEYFTDATRCRLLLAAQNKLIGEMTRPL